MRVSAVLMRKREEYSRTLFENNNTNRYINTCIYMEEKENRKGKEKEKKKISSFFTSIDLLHLFSVCVCWLDGWKEFLFLF